ncbi:hypothetical protein OCU04_002322 [Sclerotinia nivalis]|uniref:Uncharacterized protein n=1 Tax=Sclerotinia nivalis TaxID=352851 RepID=A0A9X0ATI8_9HELO|nr:hypothetical protein OCU04_002322 [Sclerotinia nivalis]
MKTSMAGQDGQTADTESIAPYTAITQNAATTPNSGPTRKNPVRKKRGMRLSNGRSSN